jgi:hypothetical protein
VNFKISPVIEKNVARLADVIDEFAKDAAFISRAASEKLDELVAAAVAAD